ncbi:SMC-Scp complex subunit ScpB [Saccharopolyspora dendranthemae]|uniref:Segregation and condensation protein B n=1 Tax=Saccharopolyspora dendranthemae TaxID=1181886 RepID=A0A561U6Z2_9PSEU|nr:SMC-Scp complex subunit ScpB [Saccharopolyspora dendranthemae]TWF95131.1 segregation and condensation protein B [Saccharopolyspora dendranthemae]
MAAEPEPEVETTSAASPEDHSAATSVPAEPDQVAEATGVDSGEERSPEPVSGEPSVPDETPDPGEPSVPDEASESGEASSDGEAQASGGIAGDDEATETQGAPDLTSDTELDAALEALLLVVDVPAGDELIAETLGQPVGRIRSALRRLSEHYAENERGIDLRYVGDGWRFYSREKYAPYVERYLLDGQRTKLTRAALETLAVIAYRQPVTRSRVAAVRGVNVDGVIRTLVGRGLIGEAGTDPETGGILYCTTELFLERLGLSSLKDLPPLAPLLPEVDSIDDV